MLNDSRTTVNLSTSAGWILHKLHLAGSKDNDVDINTGFLSLLKNQFISGWMIWLGAGTVIHKGSG